MPALLGDRFAVTISHRTTGVVMTIGEVEVAVKMPSPSYDGMSDEQVHQAELRQLKRVLEVAREELG